MPSPTTRRRSDQSVTRRALASPTKKQKSASKVKKKVQPPPKKVSTKKEKRIVSPPIFQKHLKLIALAFLTHGVRYVIGDYLAQGAPALAEIDQQRMLLMVLFGASYGAFPGYFCYNVLYPRLPFLEGRPLVMSVFDVFMQCGLVFFPMWYVAKEIMLTIESHQNFPPSHFLQNNPMSTPVDTPAGIFFFVRFELSDLLK